MEGPKSITDIIRGCGKRKPGGLYICSGLSPYGRPIQEFIIDPPIPYSGESYRTPIVIEREGRKHLMMYVGAEYYPYCSDFLEEVKQYGVSKRIPSNFPIEEIDRGAMLFLVHPKAIIVDYDFLPTVEFCPKGSPQHLESNDECCLGHSYQIAEANAGIGTRKLGDTEYTVHPHSMSPVECDFQAGIFLRVPITHFDHVLHEGKANPDIIGKSTKIPVNLENE